MTKNILLIDTSEIKQTKIGFKIGDKEPVFVIAENDRKTQHALVLIEKLLKENNLSLIDLAGIEVNTGPGSFTGLRVGISIANTLGTFLKIPINELNVGELVDARYT